MRKIVGYKNCFITLWFISKIILNENFVAGLSNRLASKKTIGLTIVYNNKYEFIVRIKFTVII